MSQTATVLLAAQLLVCARGRVVGDEMAPLLRARGEIGDERAQLRAGEVAPQRRRRHAATACGAPASRRVTFAATIAAAAAGPSGQADGASMTGRSEP